MNTQNRRRFVRSNIIDVAIAKVPISESRRERAEATKQLRKAMAKNEFVIRRLDSDFLR